MWRSIGPVAGILSICALLIVACGGGGDDRSQGCRLDTEDYDPFATSANAPSPVVSLQEARERSQFGIGLPETLPPGVSLSSVVLEPDPGCPDTQLTRVQLTFSGPAYSFVIWELPGGPGTSVGSEPIQINGVEGLVTRSVSGGEQRVTVSWADDARGYVASAALTGGLTEEAFLQVLESIP